MRTLLIAFLIPIASGLLTGLLSDVLFYQAREVLTPPPSIPYCWQLVASEQPQAEVKQLQE